MALNLWSFITSISKGSPVTGAENKQNFDAITNQALRKDNNLEEFVASPTTARTNLGAASLGANTFTGNQTITADNARLIVNNTKTDAGSSATLSFAENNVARGNLYRTVADELVYTRYSAAGAPVDNPFFVDATGTFRLGKALPVGSGGTGQVADGTAGQYLTSQGAGQPMAWTAPVDLSQSTVICELRGSNTNDTTFTDTPISGALTGRIRIKFKSAILSRGSGKTPITVKNFDAEFNINTVGLNGMDVAIASGAQVVRLFLAFNDAGQATLVGTVAATPSLTGALAAYQYSQFLVINDGTSGVWTSAFKLEGPIYTYFEPRNIASSTIAATDVVSVSFFNSHRDVMRRVNIRLFMSCASNGYGEAQIIISTQGYSGSPPPRTGIAIPAWAINYASSGTSYGFTVAQMLLPPSGLSFKLYVGGTAGAVGTIGYSISVHEIYLLNGAVS